MHKSLRIIPATGCDTFLGGVVGNNKVAVVLVTVGGPSESREVKAAVDSDKVVAEPRVDVIDVKSSGSGTRAGRAGRDVGGFVVGGPGDDVSTGRPVVSGGKGVACSATTANALTLPDDVTRLDSGVPDDVSELEELVRGTEGRRRAANGLYASSDRSQLS